MQALKEKDTETGEDRGLAEGKEADEKRHSNE
jgi:hypothetical protein